MKIFISFHLNSGLGRETNRVLVEGELKSLQRDFPEYTFYVPHLEIPPKTPEHEAMRICIRKLLDSDELWFYKTAFYMSENIILELGIAKACGIPVQYNDVDFR